MIRIVYLEPQKKPVIKEIEQEEETLQRLVKGTPVVLGPFPGSFSIVYNQEGKQMGLPVNRYIADEKGNVLDTINGSMMICSVNGGQVTGFTEEQLENFVKMFESENVFTKFNGRIINLKGSEHEG